MPKQKPRSGTRARSANGLLPGELPDLYEELKRDYGSQIEEWLDTPNLRLDLHTPRELLGTAKEIEVRDLLRRARYGMFS